MDLNIKIEEDDIAWEESSYVAVKQSSKHCISIEANKNGLISLAKQLLSLAYSENPSFYIHHWPEAHGQDYYEYGDLEEGSMEIAIIKSNKKGR